MPHFAVKDPSFEEKVKESFFRQEAMRTIGARPVLIEPGYVELEFGFSLKLTQQHGYIHAGITSAVLDSACGYAAFSLMPENTEVLTVEFKINLLSPAQGERFAAIGRVKKPGRTITVCDGELFAFTNERKKLVATMTGTLMTVVNMERIEN